MSGATETEVVELLVTEVLVVLERVTVKLSVLLVSFAVVGVESTRAAGMSDTPNRTTAAAPPTAKSRPSARAAMHPTGKPDFR
jgi:hypothetical protein